ncbi:MAG: TnsA endonuclease N-terminal domain-containing protein [Parvibaculum sp.]
MNKHLKDFQSFAGLTKVKADFRRMSKEARIVFSTTDGPLRTIITGTKRRPTGIYHSAKTGHAQPYESQAELLFMQQCEADHNVVAWLAQPHRLEMFVEGKKLIYFPDFSVVYADDREEVIEVKRDKVREVSGDLAAKLERAERIYRAANVTLRILDFSDLRAEPRHSNAEEIQRHARTLFFRRDVFLLIDQAHRDSSGAIPFARAVEVLGGDVPGKKKLCAMIVRRHFGLDLDASLTDDSPVFPVLID